MKVTKDKKQRTKTKAKRMKSSIDVLEKQAWEKVKIKGHVITEDGGDFEGLIGLEVLENYNPSLVGKGKLKKGRKEPLVKKQPGDRKQPVQSKQSVEKKHPKGKKRKADTNDEDDIPASDAESDMETDSASETEVVSRPKTKKEKQTERTLKKIQKRKERREQRKLMRKQKQKETGTAENKDNEKQNEGTLKKSPKRDRFALLRPPPPESDAESDVESEEEAPDLVSEDKSTSALQVDELEGWNGLGVPEPVLRALADKGFKSPTEIQAMTLPAAIMGKKDILGAAETGSGKTLAFGIPLIAGILELKAKQSRSGIRKAPKVKQPKEKNKKCSKTGDGETDGDDDEDNEGDDNGDEDVERELTPPPEELAYFPNLTADDDSDSSDGSVDEAEEFRRNGPLYAVVLTPTRELAVQVKEHLVAAAKYTGIKVAAVFGGLSVAKQERILRRCPEIVVATPGRFWELYEQENPHLSKINDMSFLVIDETDRMVEKGHFEELRLLLKVINADETKKQTRQNFVFSATLTLVHDLPEHMQKRNTGKRPKFVKQTAGDKIQRLIEELGISQPKIVDITRSQQTAQTLTECRLICPIDHKDYYLYYFVQRHPGRTIVFSNSIDCVKRLATIFGLLNCNPLPLHANMIQKQRLKNLERFRDSCNGLLIATDVAARGLDIPNVEHVIHYQVPRTSENYVHRSGRTARANRDGITVMFMEPGEVKSYVRLYRTLERSEDLPLFPVSERYLAAVKERVNLAREVDKQELKLRRNQAEAGWMKKHADEMEIIIDGYNDESGSDQDEDPFIIEKRRDRVHLANVRTELRNLLAKEIFPKGFSVKYPTSSGQLQMPGIATSANDPSGSISAVKVMQDAIKDMKLAKKMRNKKKRLN